MQRAERPGDLLVGVRQVVRGDRATVWTALPGIVQSFDASKMTVKVQPAVQAQVQDQGGEWKNTTLPLLTDCPVVFPSGGGYTFTVPLQEGDEGLVVFASRCIDSWWQSGGVQPQADLRMHDLSDGFFLPGVFSQPRKLANVSTTHAALRSQDGQTAVELGPEGIVLRGNVLFTGGAVVFDDASQVTGPGGGALRFNVEVSSTQNIVAGKDTGDQVGLQTHRHTSGGSGNPTSAPTPGT